MHGPEEPGTVTLQDGEKVVYSKYAGTELKLQGKEYVILKVGSLSLLGWHLLRMPSLASHARACCDAQEDDVIGILASDNIADLKPLGDRLLVEVRRSADGCLALLHGSEGC